MADSILSNIKKVVGIGPSDTSFDEDIIMHANSVLSALTQIGLGPEEGFMIEDATATWVDFIGADKRLNMVKTYVYLRVKLLFDPPSTSFVIDSMNKQIDELTFRLSVVREGDSWVDPDPAPTVTSSTNWLT